MRKTVRKHTYKFNIINSWKYVGGNIACKLTQETTEMLITVIVQLIPER